MVHLSRLLESPDPPSWPQPLQGGIWLAERTRIDSDVRRVAQSECSNKKPRWQSNGTNGTMGRFWQVVWAIGVWEAGERGRGGWVSSHERATRAVQRLQETGSVARWVSSFGGIWEPETTVSEPNSERVKNTISGFPSNAPPSTPAVRKRT